MQPKTIVIDARELRTSSGRYVERLLHYLQLVDKVNYYRVLLKPVDIDGWQPANKNFSKVSCDHKEFSFDEQIGLRKQIERLKPDLVHFAFAQQPVWYKGKTITTVHDLTTLRFNNPDKQLIIFKIKQRIYNFVIKKAVRKSAATITPTNFVKQDVLQLTGIDAQRVHVTYESADPIQSPATALPYLQNQKFIMYVGRPTPHKNLARLIEAFALLRLQHPGLLLVLAGKKDANYHRIAASVPKNLKPSIVFTDFISEGQLRWLYENCQAYVFPSLSEGFGLPGLEAMIHGAPVVSSNATCLPEIYGSAAQYFDPLDVQAMADSIHLVLSDSKLRTSLIAAGNKQVGNYSWQRMGEQTLAIYQHALR
jgi:glycosyltransferase involved in cell wall biosynthesis